MNESDSTEPGRLPIGLLSLAGREVEQDDPEAPVPALVALHQRPAREVFERAAALLIEGRTATAEQIAAVELDMGVVLPDGYKAFMTRFGGGMFGYVDLFPIVATPGEYDDLKAVNDQDFPDRSFVVVCPVGTGDHWGFPVTDGRCHDAVWFHFHDDDEDQLVAADFLEFVAEHGLKSCSDRALERRI